MKPLRLAVLTLCLLPLTGLAGPRDGDTEGPERLEKRTRMMRVLSLAEDLELNEAQAVKMADTLRQFDERRRPLMQQVRESAQVLKRAASGDASVQAQVDGAVQRVFDARTQLAALDRELFQVLAKDLPPQKRAQLAIFLARHEGRMAASLRKLDREGRDERRQERMRERMRRLQPSEGGVSP